MTLKDWSKKYGVTPHPYGPPRLGEQALAVFTDDYRGHEDAGWDLHHLEDYVVTASVSGPQKVLVRREAMRGYRYGA